MLRHLGMQVKMQGWMSSAPQQRPASLHVQKSLKIHTRGTQQAPAPHRVPVHHLCQRR